MSWLWPGIDIWTSKKTGLPDGNRHFDVNLRAVWGECARGGGATSMSEYSATLGMPSLGSGAFTQIEDHIGKWWQAELNKEMLDAGIEERNYAISQQSFHEEVPAISVIVDGG